MKESGVLKGPRHALPIQTKKDEGKRKVEVPVMVPYNTGSVPVEKMLNFNNGDNKKGEGKMVGNRETMSVDNWSVAGSHKSNVSLDVKKYFWQPMYLGGLTMGSKMNNNNNKLNFEN